MGIKYLDEAPSPSKSKITYIDDAPSIYNKGGVYEQFGPHPPSFNPIGKMAGPLEAGANQPGEALPFLGQTMGGMAFGPAGGVAGAGAGELARQGVGKMLHVQDDTGEKQFKNTIKSSVAGEALGLGQGALLEKGAEMFGPQLENAGIRVAKNIIRPTGRYAKRGDQIARTALEEGVLSNPSSMVGKIKEKTGGIEDEINNLVKNYNGSDIDAEGALSRMDALERRYRQLGDSPSSDKVASVKADIIKGQGLRKPVFSDVEKGQFVMNGGRQVSPEINVTSGSDIKGPLADLKGRTRFDSVRNQDTGKFGRSEPKRDIFIGGQNRPNTIEGTTFGNNPSVNENVLGNPEDITAMNIPKGSGRNQRIISVSPKETVQTPSGLRGPSITESVQTGVEPRNLSIQEAQGMKKGQYRLLEGKRVNGGWDASTSSPEVAARQEYAGGLRRSIAKAVPEVEPLNKRFGNLIDLGQATEKRAGITSRNNVMDLGDQLLAGMGSHDPKALAVLLSRKLAQRGQADIAKGLFGGANTMKNAGELLKNPAIRALISRQLDKNNQEN